MSWTALLYWLLRRRIRSTWPLLVITSFGIVSAVTLMAVGAGYSRVLAEGGLRHTLASTSPRVLNVHLITQNRPIGAADYTQLRSAVEGIAESRLGYMIRSMGRYGIVQGSIRLRTVPSDGPPSLDAPIGRPFFLTGFQEHSSLVAGRWPVGTPVISDDGISIEAVLGRVSARQMGISVGSQVDLYPFINDPSQRISVTITGTADPNDPSEEYWMNGPSSYFVTRDDGGPILLPIYVTEETFFDGVAAKYPSMVGDFTWFLFLDTTVLKSSLVGPTQDAIKRLETDVNRQFPRSLVLTGLKPALKEYRQALTLARVPIFVFISLVVLVVIYFLIMVMGMLARSQTDESGILRSRGASILQVSGILAVSEGIIVLASMIMGPFLALLIVRFLLAPTVNPVGGTGSIPVVLSSDMFLMGAIGGVLSLIVLLASSFTRARLGIVESLRSRARPPTLPLLQRYYIDILALFVLGFLLWEIRGREGFLTRDLASGEVKIDFLLLFGPAVVLVVVAVVVLRVLPLVVRLMSWSADRLAPAWVSFPLARFARDPLPHGSLVIILALAASLGVFGASFQPTLSVSQTHQALYSGGGDLSMSGPSLSSRDAKTLEEHEAIRTFSPIVRESVTLLDVLPGDSATLMAVDPKVLPDIVWFREDFAGKSLSELMELLRPVSLPSSSFGSGILVPGDATRIGVWVDLTGLNSGTLVSDLNLWTRIYTSQGIFHNLFLGEVSKAKTGLSARNASETGAESGWTYLEEEVKDTVNPSGEPLRLVSFYLSRKSFARTPPGTISLDDVTVKGPSSPPGGLVVEDFESSGGWAPLVNQGQAPDVVERATTAARSGNAGLRFTWEETFKDAPRGVVVPPDPFPLPAIGGPNFSVGQIVRVKAGRKLVPVVIRGTTDYFPTLNALTRPFMIVPLEPYKQYVRRTSLERVKEPNAFWASVQDDADRVQVVASLHERIGAFVSIKDRDLLVETARRNPLAGGGWNGLTFLSMTAITVAVLLTLVIHSLVAIHTGRVDLAVARTLGFSRLQLALSLALERGLTAIFGLVVGSVVGIWLSRWVLGFMDIDARGRPIIPPMVLEVQDGLVVGALGGLIAATLLGLLVAVVFVRRLNVPDVLRTGE
ncbi:MAG TPA: ABC transporter permease [Dehalococcoidia bacterium]|nr:ABC transporter permease [Dehalococcoidia bacterium]